MDGGGDAALAADKAFAAKAADRHNGRMTEESAELDNVPDSFSDYRDQTDGGRLLIHHTDRHLIRYNAADRAGLRVSGFSTVE